jgi:hypothetical protein
MNGPSYWPELAKLLRYKNPTIDIYKQATPQAQQPRQAPTPTPAIYQESKLTQQSDTPDSPSHSNRHYKGKIRIGQCYQASLTSKNATATPINGAILLSGSGAQGYDKSPNLDMALAICCNFNPKVMKLIGYETAECLKK